MPEIWLFPNRNIFLAGMLLIAPLTLLSLVTCVLGLGAPSGWTLLFAAASIGGVVCLLGLWGAMYRPRLGYLNGNLLVYLERGKPVEVPVQIVECFFLGQGAANLPTAGGKEAEAKNVIVRLAESAVEWKHRDVPPRWGHWCEGYITLNGAWCEPISNDRLAELNRKLIAAHRAVKEKSGAIA